MDILVIVVGCFGLFVVFLYLKMPLERENCFVLAGLLNEINPFVSKRAIIVKKHIINKIINDLFAYFFKSKRTV